MCKFPVVRGFFSVGCGKCQPCRVVKQTELINQLKLEYGLRPYSVFITWTYNDEFLPVFEVSKKAELYKPDLDQAVKYLRRLLEPHLVKVFGVGEYGGTLFDSPKASRPIHPHYHVMVFGSSPEILLRIRSAAERAWRFGHTHILQTSSNLMSYITGYTLKKLTNEKSMNTQKQLNIRPEFRYGRGIGDISEKIMEVQEIHGEVSQIIIEEKKVNLPRYVKNKVKRKLLSYGLDLKNPDHLLEYERRKAHEKEISMSALREKIALQDEEKMAAAGTKDRYKARSMVKKANIANFEFKMELKKSTRKERIL